MPTVTLDEIPEDYEGPSSETSSFEDGAYKVKGFYWFSTSENNKPILVAQKNGLVGRLRFVLEDGEDGPPYSLGLGEMPLLAKSFGITDLEQTPHPSQSGFVSDYMSQIENKVNAANKVIEVKVKDKWVNEVEGMVIPKGLYYFHLVDFSMKQNGVPIHKQGEYGKYFLVEFEIDAGEGGQSTPYKGSRFTEIVSYALVVENGKLDWEKTQKGEWRLAAKRLRNLMIATAPQMMAHGFDVADIENVLPEWYKALEPHTLKGQRNLKDGRVKLDWDSIEVVEGFSAQAPVVSTVESEDEKARAIFAEAIAQLVDGPGYKLENGKYSLTAEGSAVAKQYIGPLKQEGKVKAKNSNGLTFDEIQLILSTIEDERIKSHKASLAALGIGVDDELDEEGFEFDEEIPF